MLKLIIRLVRIDGHRRHEMPQIAEIEKGLWWAETAFGGHGVAPTRSQASCLPLRSQKAISAGRHGFVWSGVRFETVAISAPNLHIGGCRRRMAGRTEWKHRAQTRTGR